MTDPGVRRLDSARVLRHLGLRDQIHPLDAFVYAFPDREAYEESAKRDRELYGNDVLGPYETEAGVVGIVDIRPQLRGSIRHFRMMCIARLSRD